MTAWHTKDEWDKFMNNGQTLQDRRICVLCHRTYVTTVIETIRSQEGSLTSPIVIKPDVLLQQYRVKTNCVGGYYQQDVVTAPSQMGWEGVVGATVIHRRSRLVAKRREETKQRWLDQSAIVYQPLQPSEQPDLGELNRDFQNRSGLRPPGLAQLEEMIAKATEDKKKIKTTATAMEDDGDNNGGDEAVLPVIRKKRRMNKHKAVELQHQLTEWVHNHAIRGQRLNLLMLNHLDSQCSPLLIMSAAEVLHPRLLKNPVQSVHTWLAAFRTNPIFVRDHRDAIIQDLVSNSYEQGLVMDACLDVWQGQRLAITASRDLVCEETLDDLFGLFFSFAFGDMTKIPKETPRIRHLLMKAWPVRCWTRKSESVATKYITKDSQCDAQFHRIVLCSLLGNYRWIDNYNKSLVTPDDEDDGKRKETANRCMDPAVRYQLHKLFDAGRQQDFYRSPEAVAFRLELLKKSPQLHVHAIQLYLCSLVRSNSVVRQQAAREFDYTKFEKQVVTVTNKIRKIFTECLQDKKSGALEDLDIDKICLAINLGTSEFKKSILAKSYERKAPDFLRHFCRIPDQRAKVYKNASPVDVWSNLLQKHKVLDKSKKKIVVFQEPEYIKPSTALGKHADAMMDETGDGGDGKKEKETKTKSIDFGAEGKELGGGLAQSDGFVQQELALLKSGGVVPIPDEFDPNLLVVTKMDITVSHSKALEALLKGFDPNKCSSDDVLDVLIPHLETAFGCNKVAVARLIEFRTTYRDYQRTKQYWEEQIKQFWIDFPYTYCLIRALGQFYVRHTKIKTHSLPWSITQAQIRAVRSRTDGWLTNPDKDECCEEPMYLRACFCCRYIDTVYIPERACSVRQAAHAIPGKACKRVMINMDDDSSSESDSENEEAKQQKQKGCGVYCHNVYVYGHHRCDQRPLMEIGLLGKCLVIVDGYQLQERKRLFMLCCQKGCGQAMQVDQMHTYWNEDGIACTACTIRHMKLEYEEYRRNYAFLHDDGGLAKFKCFTCGKGLSESRDFSHWDGLKICHRCHNHNRLKPNALYDYVRSQITDEVWAMARTGKGLADEYLKPVILKYKALVAASHSEADKKKNDWTLKQLKRAKVAKKGGHS
jgi:hypothetical protein